MKSAGVQVTVQLQKFKIWFQFQSIYACKVSWSWLRHERADSSVPKYSISFNIMYILLLSMNNGSWAVNRDQMRCLH